MNKDHNPFTYNTRACRPMRILIGNWNMRCGTCYLPECFEKRPEKLRPFFIARIAELQDAMEKYCGTEKQ